jgi:hypothetical protein
MIMQLSWATSRVLIGQFLQAGDDLVVQGPGGSKQDPAMLEQTYFAAPESGGAGLVGEATGRSCYTQKLLGGPAVFQ